MSIVYRKTAKGDAAIANRTPELAPSLRRAIILVDGMKTHAELARLAKRMGDADAEATLAALQAGGHIEATVLQAATSAEAQPRPVAAAPAAALPRASSVPANWIATTRRDAARHLIDKLGPTAEGLAIKLEGAKTVEELSGLLTDTAQVLASVRGADVGREFAQRFLADTAV
jgi:hypothetical protein